MKLRIALMATKGPPGLWLLDHNGEALYTISINGPGATVQQLQQVAAAIAHAMPDGGIEVPE